MIAEAIILKSTRCSYSNKRLQLQMMGLKYALNPGSFFLRL